MEILVIGLNGVTLADLFDGEGLPHIRRLLELGCYGLLESSVSLTPEQIWLSVMTGREPETLGADASEAADLRGRFIWDQVLGQGKRAILAGWLPCEPAEEGDLSIRRCDDRWPALVQSEPWDYFQFVTAGLDPDSEVLSPLDELASRDPRRGGCWRLDTELGQVLETLSNDTVILLVLVQDAEVAENRSVDGVSGSAVLGLFALAAPNSPLMGEMQGAHLTDIAPTLLALAGYQIPGSMQGKPLVSGSADPGPTVDEMTSEEEEILRERLSGLGYI
jgi:hypothetical protein